MKIYQVTVYAEKESGEALDHVDNIHWVYGRKISEQKIYKQSETFENFGKHWKTLKTTGKHCSIFENFENKSQFQKLYCFQSYSGIVNVMIASQSPNDFLR